MLLWLTLLAEKKSLYFKWLEPLKNTLQEHALGPGNWHEIQLTPKWHSWLGYAFESICYKHINQIRKKLSISPAAVANSWRYLPQQKSGNETGARIDLLFDRMDDAITICEIKYSEQPFIIDKEYAKNLRNKCAVFSKITHTKSNYLLR